MCYILFIYSLSRRYSCCLSMDTLPLQSVALHSNSHKINLLFTVNERQHQLKSTTLVFSFPAPLPANISPAIYCFTQYIRPSSTGLVHKQQHVPAGLP